MGADCTNLLPAVTFVRKGKRLSQKITFFLILRMIVVLFKPSRLFSLVFLPKLVKSVHYLISHVAVFFTTLPWSYSRTIGYLIEREEHGPLDT